MNDDLDLMQLARSGELLATVDSTDYRAVHVVFAWDAGGVPAIYCRYQDWAATPAARLADAARQIAELGDTLERWAAETLAQTQRATVAEARIKELEQQLAETPRQNQERMVHAQSAALDTPPGTPAAADPVPCPDCGATFKNERALRMHQQRTHQGMVAGKKMSPAPAIVLPEAPWRCAECHESTHARSLKDPALCIRCVVTQTDAQLANGHEIAA